MLGRGAADLVDNALRHGRPGGRVTVRLGEGELTVGDGGPVIAAEDLELPRLAIPPLRARQGMVDTPVRPA